MKIPALALSLVSTALLISPMTMAESPAPADPDKEKAIVRFRQGTELYREGIFEGALAEFRKAYQLSPSYRLLYNIAFAQYELHDFVGAYKSFMQYLTEGVAEIPPDRRTQVDDMLLKIMQRIAHMEITTNVAGADVRVDDVSVGTSPLPGPVLVNVGTRKVTVSKPGSPEAVRMVTVAGKERVKVSLEVAEGPALSAHQPERPAQAPPSVIIKTNSPPKKIRPALVVCLSATAALAVATGTMGWLTLGAKKDFKDKLDIYPGDKNGIEDARTKAKTYGYVTDGLAAATLVSGGLALYFALSNSDSEEPSPPKAKNKIVLAPTMGGMLVQGSF